jgi:ATP-dependent helicase HrpA
MEIRQGAQTLIGFPALIDAGDAVTIEVFDEPELAAARHRAGLRRLFALQLRDALKYLEKNLPDLQKMAVAFMPLGTQEELRDQVIEVALERAFLLDPLPADAAGFQRRLDEGRGRLTLIANEVARLAATVLAAAGRSAWLPYAFAAGLVGCTALAAFGLWLLVGFRIF